MSSPSFFHSDSDRPQPGDLPPGCPQWVTAELIAETIRVWQPYYAAPLTADEALAMILSAGGLFETLQRESEP